MARYCLGISAVAKLSLECQAIVFPQFPLCEQRPLGKAEYTLGRGELPLKRQKAYFFQYGYTTACPETAGWSRRPRREKHRGKHFFLTTRRNPGIMAIERKDFCKHAIVMLWCRRGRLLFQAGGTPAPQRVLLWFVTRARVRRYPRAAHRPAAAGRADEVAWAARGGPSPCSRRSNTPAPRDGSTPRRADRDRAPCPPGSRSCGR